MAATVALLSSPARNAMTDPPPTSPDVDLEARFLIRRRRQLPSSSEAANNESGQQSNDALRQTFWTAIRRQCAGMDEELDRLFPKSEMDDHTVDTVNGSGGDENTDAVGNDNRAESGALSTEQRYATAHSRSVARDALDGISNQLKLLQRHCHLLYEGESSTLSNNTATNFKGGNGCSVELPPVPDNLPAADVRLLSDAIGKLQHRISETREIICPRELFVFKRYRAAVVEREARRAREAAVGKEIGAELGREAPELVTEDAVAKADEKTKGESDVEVDGASIYGASLRGLSSCRIVVGSNGKIMVLGNNSEVDLSTDSGEDKDEEKVTSSLLIRDIDRCQIQIQGQYESLHLVNVNSSTISVSPRHPIIGPVHVTACSLTTIAVACRQLRIHDCVGVTFRTYVASGPIIENCTEMTFRGDYAQENSENMDVVEMLNDRLGTNLYKEVKDFNWLKTLVPSPNFVIIDTTTLDVEGQRKTNENAESAGDDCNIMTNGMTEVSGDVSEGAGESSDDEDEL